MTTFIDVHVLQTVPPSNINRDDTGSPKTAIFGGSRRARVSSQAWKRATRSAFSALLDTSELGVRTKQLIELVEEEIARQAPELSNRGELAKEVVTATGIKLVAPRKKKDEPEGTPESGYLVFLAHNQVQRLAELAIDSVGGTIEKKKAKEAANTANSVDVALFGRMIADDAELNVDAAAQVAHAISVHKVDNEYDYFTAVDDRKTKEQTGAGMIGTVEFNSSTLYRYATVNVDGLKHNLNDNDTAAERAVRAFLQAFITSMPTGKQNTFANRTLPDAVVVQVREGQPVNLVGAFEDAVVARQGKTRLAVAADVLAAHSHRVDEAFGTAPQASFVVSASNATAALESLGAPVSLAGLLDGVAAALVESKDRT